jgi:hypothetical protein
VWPRLWHTVQDAVLPCKGCKCKTNIESPRVQNNVMPRRPADLGYLSLTSERPRFLGLPIYNLTNGNYSRFRLGVSDVSGGDTGVSGRDTGVSDGDLVSQMGTWCLRF